jgi:hypothetical protein
MPLLMRYADYFSPCRFRHFFFSPPAFAIDFQLLPLILRHIIVFHLFSCPLSLMLFFMAIRCHY